jgi:hypothetical protein
MAGGWGTTIANDILKLFLQAVAIANLADNAAASPLTVLYLSLHTASPSGAGQTTSEAAYTSYARKSIARASGAGGFTVSTNTGALTDALTSFVAATGGSETETHFGLGTASSGAGKLIVWGTVTPNIVVSNGVTPQLTSAVFLTLGT